MLLQSSNTVSMQWDHPLLHENSSPIPRTLLQSFAYDYFLRFSKFFRGQEEGSLQPGITIELSIKMKNRLGSAHLFDRIIRLNANYFSKTPTLLPYTLFHEMVHMWLYDCDLDPAHTHRFYRKMMDFYSTGLTVDPNAYIHRKISSDSKFQYRCDGCGHKWFVNDQKIEKLYCHHCNHKGERIYPRLFRVY